MGGIKSAPLPGGGDSDLPSGSADFPGAACRGVNGKFPPAFHLSRLYARPPRDSRVAQHRSANRWRAFRAAVPGREWKAVPGRGRKAAPGYTARE